MATPSTNAEFAKIAVSDINSRAVDIVTENYDLAKEIIATLIEARQDEVEFFDDVDNWLLVARFVVADIGLSKLGDEMFSVLGADDNDDAAAALQELFPEANSNE